MIIAFNNVDSNIIDKSVIILYNLNESPRYVASLFSGDRINIGATLLFPEAFSIEIHPE